MMPHPRTSSPARNLARRRLGRVIALGLALAASAAEQAAADEWPTAAPEDAGLAADLGDRLDAVLATPFGDGLHAVVLIRDGALVYEWYGRGVDEIYGRRKDGVVFGPQSLHDQRSITKSVVGIVYGIALGDGTVPAPEAAVLAAFPEYADLAADPARAAITLDDVLAMTTGAEWDEDLPYNDPKNSEIAMNRAPDSVRFALERPLVATPGAAWTYNGGTTTIAAALIARGNGGDLADYVRARLFEPLGIDRFEWISDYYGQPHAASGLRLRPRDVARIGQLVVDRGAWRGRQIVPASWIEQATSRQAEAQFGCGYGYQWWLCPLGSGLRLIEAAGWGGQELLILPDERIVLVVNAGLYGDREAYQRAFKLLEETILPAIEQP